MQQLFASPYMRVNTTTDVTGVEICGALKNVLALAAGIVEGLDLGHNAMAALVAQARGFLPSKWADPRGLSNPNSQCEVLDLSRGAMAALPTLVRRAMKPYTSVKGAGLAARLASRCLAWAAHPLAGGESALCVQQG